MAKSYVYFNCLNKKAAGSYYKELNKLPLPG